MSATSIVRNAFGGKALPLLFVPVIAVLGLITVKSPTTWLTLTMAGLAMGMLIFIISSGLTLVFGLMDVVNFGHGAFIGLGAYLAFSLMTALSGLLLGTGLMGDLLSLVGAASVAMLGAGILGLLFERFVIRRVYGDHLKQILITMGGAIVVEQILMMIWGASERQLSLPASLTGAIPLLGASVERYRIVIVGLGVLLFVAMMLLLVRTRIGLLVRAGVEDPEMVRALGFPLNRLFVGVFVLGSALGGLGGVMWALYRGTLTANLGGELMIMVFVVIVIGGLGSITGCFIGAILVAIINNYVAFLFPNLAVASSILVLMLVLAWRPNGLFPLTTAKR